MELKDKVVIFDDKNRTQDIIRMDSDIVLTDKHGNEIEVKSMPLNISGYYNDYI